MILRTLYATSSLLTGIGLLLMGLALLGTSLGLRAVNEGFSDLTTGIIMSSYFAGFIIGTYLCPGLIRGIGPIRTYAALAAIGSVCALLHALLVFPLAWILLRCIVGICLVGLYMAVESWLNTIAPNDKRGQIFAIYMMTTLAAHAAGQFLLLLDPTVQIAAFAIAAAFFSLGLVPVALTRLPQPQPVSAPTLHLRQLVQYSPLSVAGALAGGLTTSSFWALGAVFANRIGLEGGDIVTFMAITIAGGVLLQWPIGHLSDRYDRRYIILAVALLAALVTMLAALLYGISHYWLFACFFMFGAMIFPIYALSVAYLNDRIHTDEALEASRGMLLVFGVGAFLGPVLAGLTMDYLGPTGLLYYNVFILCLFALYTLPRIRVSPAVPEAERSTFMPMTRTSQAVLELDPRTEFHEEPERPAETPAPEETATPDAVESPAKPQ